jgi:hypothetical protein
MAGLSRVFVLILLDNYGIREFFLFNRCMNNQRLHHTNSTIRIRKDRTENMALNKVRYMTT